MVAWGGRERNDKDFSRGVVIVEFDLKEAATIALEQFVDSGGVKKILSMFFSFSYRDLTIHIPSIIISSEKKNK